ncbi:MAG: hypothetical protein MRY83_23465, partial [Flavobacteriales bacterium]|nr:hypothetical protein [Flavobacteriales bacterium]
QRDVLRIDGKIREGKEKLQNVKVSLLSDGEEIAQINTEKSGRFKYILPLQKDYFVVFSKPGYRSKYILVQATNIPEGDAAFGYEFGGLDVSLFKKVKGLNDKALDQPIAKIVYDTNQYKFIFDATYFEQIQEEMDSLKDALAEKQEDTEELLALETAAAQEEQDEIAALEASKENIGQNVSDDLGPSAEELQKQKELAEAERKIEEEKKRLEALEAERKKQEQEKARKAKEEEQRLAEEAEKRRLEALEQKRKEAEAKQKALEAEAKRKAEEEAEKQRLKELEEKRKEEEAEIERLKEIERMQKAAEAEKKRLEELERKKKEEEAEIQRLKELEEKRKEEEAARLAAEEAAKKKAAEQAEKERLEKLQEEKLAEEKRQAELAAKQKEEEEYRKKKEAFEKAKAKLEAEKKKLAAQKTQNAAAPDKSKEIVAANPPGITKKVFRQGNKTITKYTIVNGEVGTEYRRVVADWGGKYFFKNDISITEREWTQETSSLKVTNE